ncbi:MAG: type II secretion system F family protein [Bdellovibrionota bacterium]
MISEWIAWIQGERFKDEVFLYFIVSLGLLSLGVLAFGVIFFNYAKIEAKIKDSISEYAARLYDLFDRMYLRKPLNHCFVIIIASTGIFGFIGFVVGLLAGLFGGLVGGLVFGVFGFKLPGLLMNFIFKRRVEKFDRQLVDALNMMSNAIKSGLSFMQVIQLIERELPNPASQEFAMVLKENRLGVNLNDALLNMVKRIPSEDLFMIMNSVVTLSQQGGDLSEAFETIANTIRERQRVTEKIRTLAQAGITQATILSCLPLVMLLIMYVIQPDHVRLLFTTPLGISMLVGMFVLMGLGILWMKKLLTIDV